MSEPTKPELLSEREAAWRELSVSWGQLKDVILGHFESLLDSIIKILAGKSSRLFRDK